MQYMWHSKSGFNVIYLHSTKGQLLLIVIFLILNHMHVEIYKFDQHFAIPWWLHKRNSEVMIMQSLDACIHNLK